MLLGLNYKPERSLPALDHMDDANALNAFRALRERTSRLVATLPTQYDYLTICGPRPAPWRLKGRAQSSDHSAFRIIRRPGHPPVSPRAPRGLPRRSGPRPGS